MDTVHHALSKYRAASLLFFKRAYLNSWAILIFDYWQCSFVIVYLQDGFSLNIAHVRSQFQPENFPGWTSGRDLNKRLEGSKLPVLLISVLTALSLFGIGKFGVWPRRCFVQMNASFFT